MQGFVPGIPAIWDQDWESSSYTVFNNFEDLVKDLVKEGSLDGFSRNTPFFRGWICSWLYVTKAMKCPGIKAAEYYIVETSNLAVGGSAISIACAAL